jgi:branched-chain amino acid transport system substrate-binding protein
MNQTTLSVVILTLGICTAGAPLHAQQPVSREQPIRIGATMSLTGPLATQGVPARNGYLLCQDDVNRQGGVLGRHVEFVIHDDASDPAAAVALYERLITAERVDAVMGPYGSTHTEAVAPVTERHRQVMISPLAATSSIWEQGRRYLFMVLPPAELFLAGLIEMAADNGLTRVAIIQQDALFPRAAGAGAAELARRKGMEVVLHETYATGTTDFSALLYRVQAGGADVLGMAASSLDDFIAVVRQMQDNDINVGMFGTSGAVSEFQAALGDAAEYSYGLSAWEPSLSNPGIAEFVAAYRRDFGQEPSFHAAGAYGSCQLLMEAARRAGSLDADALRAELLSLETQTVFSDYAVDERGYQTANRGLFIQWQDGEKVVVWPPDVATAAPRFPTPMWSDRPRRAAGPEKRQDEFLAAMAARDADRVAAMFADDAVLHIAGMPPIAGRAAIHRFYGNMFGFLSASSATPESLHVSGDMAYGTGHSSNEFRGADGPVSYAGKYLLVWKREGSEWFIAAYSISSNQPDGAGR